MAQGAASHHAHFHGDGKKPADFPSKRELAEKQKMVENGEAESEEDPFPSSPRMAMKVTPASYLEALRVIRKDGLLFCNVAAFGLVRAGNVNMFFMFVLFTNYRLQWGIFDTSLALGCVGALGVAWQSIGLKYVVDRLHHHVVPILIAIMVGYPLLMIGYGAVTTTTQMYLVAIAGSATSIGPAIFTAKITTLSGPHGIAGSALGVVGSITCLLELPFSYLFSKLLSYTISVFEPNDVGAGLPYFVNSLVYAAGLIFVLIGDQCFSEGRKGWRIPQHDHEQKSAV